MERTVEKLRGWAEVRVYGAEPELFLNICAQNGVALSQCRSVSEAELQCVIPRRYLRRAEQCAERARCEMEIISRRGGSYTLGRVKKRHVLLLGLFLVLMLLGFSGMFIWDIDIVGNETVPEHRILGALEECGVYIGANWTSFNADMIRSGALQRIPELSFLTVNVKGSRATVIVRERIEPPETDSAAGYADMVAAKSGVIKKIAAFRGHPLVAIGDQVQMGDVLISGSVPGVELWEKPTEYSYVSSLGQVWAETEYEFTAAGSLIKQEKQYTGRVAKNYALIFGENRLNFYKNTGIYRSGCDTIYYVWKLEVPGLFTLPVSLVSESRAQYELAPADMMPEQVEKQLRSELLARLQRELGQGSQVISTDFSVRAEGDMLYVELRAKCLEDIALKREADVTQYRNEDT